MPTTAKSLALIALSWSLGTVAVCSLPAEAWPIMFPADFDPPDWTEQAFVGKVGPWEVTASMRYPTVICHDGRRLRMAPFRGTDATPIEGTMVSKMAGQPCLSSYDPNTSKWARGPCPGYGLAFNLCPLAVWLLACSVSAASVLAIYRRRGLMTDVMRWVMAALSGCALLALSGGTSPTNVAATLLTAGLLLAWVVVPRR